MKTYNRNCIRCDSRLPADRFYRKAKYCSNECRKEEMEERKGKFYSGISKGNKGALSELLVCADLIKKGYYVFRSITPNSPCDLVIFNGKQTVKLVEVKTAHYDSQNKLIIPPTKKNKYDILASVLLNENKIIYKPKIKENKKIKKNVRT